MSHRPFLDGQFSFIKELVFWSWVGASRRLDVKVILNWWKPEPRPLYDTLDFLYVAYIQQTQERPSQKISDVYVMTTFSIKEYPRASFKSDFVFERIIVEWTELKFWCNLAPRQPQMELRAV